MVTKSHRLAISAVGDTVYTYNPKSGASEKVKEFNLLQMKIKSNLETEREWRAVHNRLR